MRKRLFTFCLISFLLASSLLPASGIAEANGGKAILLNNGFEETAEAANGWDVLAAPHWSVWKPAGNPVVSLSEDAKYSGSYGVKIEAESEGRTALSQDVSVEGGRTYEVSTWLKTANIVSSQGARMRVVLYKGTTQTGLLYSNRLTGTNDWTRVKMDVKVPIEVDSIRVQLFFETGTGTAMFDDVSIQLINPALSIAMDDKEKNIQVGEVANLKATMNPIDATSVVSWSSSNQSVVTVNDEGSIKGISVGEAMITVSTDNGLSSSTLIRVGSGSDLEPVTNLVIEPKTMILTTGQVRLLETKVEPDNANKDSLVWRTSNNEVVSVQNGVIEAKGPGEAVITVETEDGSLASSSEITVNSVELDEFDQLRKHWENQITSLAEFDAENPRMVEIVENEAAVAEKLFVSMNKNADRKFLWANAASETNSADIRESYRNLQKMTKAVTNEHSTLYQNREMLESILSGLEWLYENRYNKNIKQYSNWWHWEIGVPNELNNIMVLLYDYIDKETRQRYLDVIDHFQPDPTKSGVTTPEKYREAVGANRIDVSKVVGVRGILVKDAAKIASARDALSQTFENVTTGDGFYKDGSFVQHENIAYSGSYGIVLIDGLSVLLDLLNGSSWAVTDPKVDNVYKWIETAYEPFVYKGALMDMVRGRAISRSFLQDHHAGHSIIKAVIRMAEFAPEPYADKYKRMAKYWILEDKYRNYIEHANNFKDITLAKELLENNSIIPRGDIDFHKTYAGMDRVVNRKPGYAFGISMYSNRIQNYEDMNNENRKGWYTGDGMTYLYNADLSQFSDDFWPTVDPYRLPGTTVDTMKRADGSGEHTSSESWVGGSTLHDKYGSTGMAYKGWNSSLTAKKSWFMFDDEIVALGSGITSREERNIETIVENRKIKQDQSNRVTVNGETLDLGNGHEQIVNAKWAFLEGNTQGADIGYYFPNERDITLKKEERTGAWSDINYGEPTDTVKRAYATMWVNHGVKPEDDTYSYVLLPSKSEDQTRKYAEQPEVQILRNDKDVQAVRELKNNIIGANFWNDGEQTVGPLTVKQKASVTMQEKDGVLEIAISDPTMQNEGIIEVAVKEKMTKLLEADENIQIQQDNQSFTLVVDVKEARGETFTAKIQLEADGEAGGDSPGEEQKPSPKPEVPSPNPDNIIETTPVLSNGTAEGNITEKALTDAFANAPKVKGVKTVQVIVEKLSGAKTYELNMPTDFLTRFGKNNQIQVSTEFGKITLQGHMLSNAELKGVDTVTFVIAKGEPFENHPTVELSVVANGKRVDYNHPGAPVKVMIPYQPTAEELKNPEKITVWYIDGKGNSTPVVSGSYDVKAGGVTFKTTHFSRFAVVYVDKVFLDLKKFAWAKAEIEALAAKGIINGTTDTTFDPSHHVTRADFTSLLVRALGLTAEVDSNFTDVSPSVYYYGEVGIAKKLGIINGRTDNRFDPRKTITREEMFAITARAMKVAEVFEDKGNGSDVQQFADHSKISAYALEDVATLVKAGLIKGDEQKRINPKDASSRAEAAVMLYRLYNY